MTSSRKHTIKLIVSAEQLAYLRMLRTSQATPGEPVEGILRYLVASICDGIRREGSWEHQCVLQIFGEYSDHGSPDPAAPWSRLPSEDT